MKARPLYIFIISFLLFSEVFSQENTSKIEKSTEELLPASKKQNSQRYGIRLGVDISKPIRSFFDKDYFGIELSGDYRYNYRYYFAAELGKERKKTTTDYFNFTTDGQYLKLGIDYNGYDNWYGMQNLIYVGARYGFSQFRQEVNSYTLHTLHHYWQENTQGNIANIQTSYNGRTGHWLELLVGVKVELFKNLYAGASVRFSKILYQKKNDFPNFWMPGVGRVWENGTYGINYNYTISYLIPLYRKAKEPENKK